MKNSLRINRALVAEKNLNLLHFSEVESTCTRVDQVLIPRKARFDSVSIVSRESDLATCSVKRHSIWHTYVGRIAAILVLILTLGAVNAWGTVIYQETFGNNGDNNTVIASATCYTATTSMFTSGHQTSVVSNYSGDSKVGKGTTIPSDNTDASGYSAVWFTGSKNTTQTITLFKVDNIDISGYTSLKLKFNVKRNDGTTTTNAITVKYKIDSGSEQTLTGYSVPTGTGWTWSDELSLTGTGSSLTITFSHYTTGGYTSRLDDIILTGTASGGGCSVAPSVGLSLTSVSATVNSITATVPISAIGGCNITENGLVYSTSVATPEVGAANCTKVTTTACGSTAADKTVEITGLTCGQSYYVRGYATNAAGTSYTNVTSQSTSACPVYTVTLKDDNSTYTQASYGASVTLPSRSSCTGYTFAGWTKTWTEEQDEWTTTAPTIIPAGSYTPTANENLYPVYTKTEGGGAPTTKNLTNAEIIARHSTSNPNTTSYANGPFTLSSTDGDWYGVFATQNNSSIYTVNIKSDNVTISDVATRPYLRSPEYSGDIASISITHNGTTDRTLLICSSATADPGNDKIATISITSSNQSGVSANLPSGVSQVYLYSSSGGIMIKSIAVTVGGSTTSYISVPNCCTALGTINGSVSLTQGGNSVTISGWSDVSNVGTYTVKLYKKNGASWDLVSGTAANGAAGTAGTRTGITGASKSVTFTGLIVESEYKFTVQAITGSGSYCDGAETDVTEINSTDVSSTPFKFRYSIYIDNGSGSGWAHHYITPTANANEGSVAITLGAHVDYYQFKIAGGFSGWWGQTGTSKIPANTKWTLNGDQNVRLETGAGGSYTFTVDYSGTTNPGVTVTFPSADQGSGYKVYFDKSVIDGWGNTLKYRIGNGSHNQNQDFTLVTGTDNFYVTTTPSYGSMDAWQIANNVANSGSNSIYNYHNNNQYDITKATIYLDYAVDEDITIVPTSKKNTENSCDFWYVSKTSGMLTHTATITAPSNGAISLAYTDVSGTAQNKTTTTAGLAHRTKITATATPSTGYQLGTFTVTPEGGAASNLTSGATDNHILATNATFAATFSAKTYTITLDDEDATTSGSANVVLTYNSHDHAAITNPAKTGQVFAGWWSGDNGVGTLVIDASGVLKSNVTVSAVSWTDASGNWVYDGTPTLHAKWEDPTYDYTLVESAGDIGPGDYLIVYNNTYALNTHNGNINANTYATYTDISDYYDNKTIASNSTTDALAFVVEATTNGYSFYKESEETYLGYNSDNSSTGSKLRWDNSFTANQNEWTLGVGSVVSVYDDNVAIRWNNNSGSYRFAIYSTSGQQAIQLFKKAYEGPTIIVSADLDEFTYERGKGPSAAQTFVVRGVLLTGNLTVTAPSNYEVSLDGETWAGTQTITASGTLSATTVYVRLASGLSANDYNGNVSISGGGATTKNVAVEGSVTCPTPSLSFAAPIVMKASDAANFTNTLTVTGNEGNGAITYTSSDASKASVDPATGEVDILAATDDGDPVIITATVAAVTGENCQNSTSLSYNLVIGYPITWHVNNNVYTEGSPTTVVASGGSIEALPSDPDGTAICGNKVFVGWTETANYTNATTAPGDLFKAASGAPTPISSAKNFYAVFAEASAGSSNEYMRARTADDISFTVGQKLVIVDNENSKILNSGFTSIAAPSETSGKITVNEASKVWTLTEQDEAKYWILKSGDVQLGANSDDPLEGGSGEGHSYRPCGNYSTYTSAWVIKHSSEYEESVEDCFYLFNWINEDGSEDENEDGLGEFYNALRCYNGSAWEVQYAAEITSSNKAHYAMRIYVPAVSYTNYAVTCTTPHTVTVTSGGHGTVTASPVYVVDGESTTLTLTPNEGYECSSVTLTSGKATAGTLSNCSYTLTNITTDVTLTATFTKAPTYSVLFDAGQGKIVGQNANSVTLTETTRTYGVHTPKASSCADGWTFAYWSTGDPEDEDNTTVPAHTTDANQNYVPSTNNEHLYAIYTKTTGTPVYAYGTDVITRSTTGVPDQSSTTVTYTDWSDKAATTAARYAGQSAGGKGVIQLRDQSPAGIVSTTSGGTLNEVKIYWNSNTSSNRSIDIYGYNTAYTSGADVYGGTGTTAKGTKLGSVSYDSGTPTNTFTVTGSYAYVGLRPKGGALYLDQVDIKWITGVSGLTTYYCHKPTCDDCTEHNPQFAKSEVTLTYPHAGTYTNTLTTSNTNTKAFTSSNTNVATIADASTGALNIVGMGTTIISVHQDRMTTGSKYCAVDESYTLIVKGASVEVVEINTNNEIIIEHDLGGNTGVLIDQLVLHEEGNKAEEVFISKYFEATGSVKLVALYNGTGKSYDPSKYRIRCASTSATSQHIVKVGDYVDSWPSGKELIFYSWDTGNESDLNVMDCVDEKNDNGEINMSEWISVPWSNYSANKPGLIFGGKDAIVLEEYDGSQWNILDIVGALTADGKKADGTALVGTSTITWGDGSNKGWYCATGRELGGNENADYALSTLRCLLVRKFDVLSGKAARNTTTGNLGTGDFKTLGTEWYGKQVSKNNAETSTCNSFSEVGNFDYYESYQKYEELNTSAFTADKNADGTVTISIDPTKVDGGLAGLSCNYLKIKVTNEARTQELANVEYKVPIIVSAANETDDAIFTKFEDCSICDVAILQDGVLTTVDGGKNTINDVQVYRGGKLIVPDGETLNINALSMRSEGDIVPKADIQGTLNRIDKTLYFDKRIDGNRWYFFALPYDCDIADITFRDGTNAVHGEDYLIQYYDGAERASQATASYYTSVHWKPFEESTLAAGQGYILAVQPKSGHTYAELRFPMKNPNLAKTSTGVAVRAWGGDKTSEQLAPNHKGWNLIGNPFLNTYKKEVLGEPLQLGTLEYNQETGSYDLVTTPVSKNVRFVYVPIEGGSANYAAVAVSLQDLDPFYSYFTQVAGDPSNNLGVSFTSSNVEKASIVSRSREEVVNDKPIWVILDLFNSKQEKDETTILISDQFTDDYDLMDDGLKWRGDYYTYYTRPVLASRNSSGEMAFNALPDASAKAGIPLSYFAKNAGEYTFSLNGVMGFDEIKEVQLWDAYDGHYYDLLTGDQTFDLSQGNNTDRFTLFVTVERKKVEEVATDNENISAEGKLSLVAIDNTLVLSGLRSDANVYVYDMSGKLMTSDRVVGNGVWRTTVPATGVYFVRVNSASGQQTLQTIVK